MGDSGSTKLAFADAMKRLMRKKPFGKISVGDICGLCGMNRKSFYYHFRDKYDLVTWIYDIEFYSLIQQQDYCSWYEFAQSVCRYLYSEREFYINAFQVTGQNSFCEHFKHTVSELWQAFSDPPDPDPAVYRYVSEAFLAAVVCWLNDGAYDSEDFIKQIRRALRSLNSGDAQEQ